VAVPYIPDQIVYLDTWERWMREQAKAIGMPAMVCAKSSNGMEQRIGVTLYLYRFADALAQTFLLGPTMSSVIQCGWLDQSHSSIRSMSEGRMNPLTPRSQHNFAVRCFTGIVVRSQASKVAEDG
jgi:hypothetical protein